MGGFYVDKFFSRRGFLKKINPHRIDLSRECSLLWVVFSRGLSGGFQEL